MIDVTDTENLLTLKQAWSLMRKVKRKLHINTVREWTRPTDDKGNPKLYLETVKLGGIVFTSKAALRRFAVQQEQLTAPPSAERTPSPPPSQPLPIHPATLAGLQRHGLTMPGNA